MKNKKNLLGGDRKNSSSFKSPSRKKGKTFSRSRPHPHEEALKKARVVVGTHSILESLKVYPKGALALWLKAGFESHQDLVELESLARKHSLSVVIKPGSHLEAVCLSHQGAVLFQSQSPLWPSVDLWKDPEAQVTLVLLDGLEDPHNLGAIMRTSWLMGVQGVMIPQHRAVGLTPVVHKVASGGVEHVPLLVVGSFASILEDLKEKGFWIFGLSHEAPHSCFQFQLPKKVVWCIGAEDKGLRSTTKKLCDELLSLPQKSPEASYNASVAAGMVLFETFRQCSLRS
jgi:23S rRNA (guanosine2251-2'-O)-methyltransferase